MEVLFARMDEAMHVRSPEEAKARVEELKQELEGYSDIMKKVVNEMLKEL